MLKTIVQVTVVLLLFMTSHTVSANDKDVIDTISEKVDKVEEVATKVSNSDLAEFSVVKLEEFFNIAEEVLDRYGESAVDLGLNVLRIDAASSIVIPFILFIIFSLATRKVRSEFSARREKRELPEVTPVIMTEDEIQLLSSALSKTFDARSSREDLSVHRWFQKKSRDVAASPSDERARHDAVARSQFLREKGFELNMKYDETDYALLFVGLGFTIGTIISFIFLIDLWAWIGIFVPEIYAVYKFIL